MAYQPIRTSADLAARLIPGVTREGHWLDFKGLDATMGRPYRDNDRGKEECRLDVAAFANEDGGTIVIGAQETDHVLARFVTVPDAQDMVRWFDEVLKEKLEPRPAIEPHVVRAAGGEEVIAINIPPSLRLIGLRSDDWYAFPVRTTDSRRYLTLAEVEARMQDRDRVHRLRLLEIGGDIPIGLDARIDDRVWHDGWKVQLVEQDIVTLVKDGIPVATPLAYVEAVYPAGLEDASWVIALSCYLSKGEGRSAGQYVVTKEVPGDRLPQGYQPRWLQPKK